jgi:GT2 family glycosyltransferase
LEQEQEQEQEQEREREREREQEREKEKDRYDTGTDVEHELVKSVSADLESAGSATIEVAKPESEPNQTETESPSGKEEAATTDEEAPATADDEEEVLPPGIPAELAQIRVSVVIPTAIHRKPVLEECLAALNEYTDSSATELIIIDNASLDDTYDYLDQLREDGFMNIRVITNRTNRGFAAAANQGIRVARGQYICVMHNDVVVSDDVTGKLADLLDANDEFALIGPVTNRCMNPDQIRHGAGDETGLQESELVDSFCMMFRAGADPAFDEAYGLAFLEDADICRQLRNAGWKTGIATRVYTDHYQGATTFEIGLEPSGPEYWINVARFKQKWNLTPDLPDFGDADEVSQLSILGDIMNTYLPEEHLLEYARGLLTSETRTRLMEISFDRDRLGSLIRALLLLDQRDILRHLEEKMDHFRPQPDLALRLIHYYYERNIYSRCMKYIEACGSSLPVTEKIFRLRIAAGEKDFEKAVILLNELMNEAPVNPGVYKLAGNIHKMEGNMREAGEFYALANQIDPLRYGETEKSGNPWSNPVL